MHTGNTDNGVHGDRTEPWKVVLILRPDHLFTGSNVAVAVVGLGGGIKLWWLRAQQLVP